MRALRRWMLDERGLETVEYAVLAGLMVSGIVAVVFAIGNWLNVRYRFVARMLYGGNF